MLEGTVRKGLKPWCPHPDATALDVWDVDGVPVLGTYRIGAETYLFMGANGSEGTAIPWAYLRLAESERLELEDVVFDSADSMYNYARRLFSGKRIIVADAEDHTVIRWNVYTVGDSATGVLAAMVRHLETVNELLNEQLADLERIRDGQNRRREIRDKQAEVAPVRKSALHFRELIPA